MDKSGLRNLSYGLYIVSTKDKENLAGCVVNAIMQITSAEPIIAISLNKNNYTNELISQTKKVAINILSKSIDLQVIQTFGFNSSKDVNKYANLDYELVNDLPILTKGINSYIIGDVIDKISVATHDIFLVKVIDSQKVNEEESLTYLYYQKNMKGVSSKNAPTYIEKEIANTNSKKYRCMICGHIYDDAIEKVKFEDLPDNWVCPKCGVSKDKFERIN